jgi:DNA repair protein RecN (Recombination protein N)
MTPDALPDALATIEGELAHLEEGELGREELETLVAAALAELEGAARSLAKARKAAAPKLEKAIHAALATLGLQNARFEVGLAPRGAAPRERFGAHGPEDLEFRLAANPGDPCRPLRHVASGGEAARIMLALRSVLCAGDKGRTLVFDEIDSGVGGRLGPEVGACLRALAANHQVLCVTHLPAIAAVAERHLSISKEVQGGRTRTTIVPLAGEARVGEIADMIAGGADEKTARAEARRLLEGAKSAPGAAKGAALTRSMPPRVRPSAPRA